MMSLDCQTQNHVPLDMQEAEDIYLEMSAYPRNQTRVGRSTVSLLCCCLVQYSSSCNTKHLYIRMSAAVSRKSVFACFCPCSARSAAVLLTHGTGQRRGCSSGQRPMDATLSERRKRKEKRPLLPNAHFPVTNGLLRNSQKFFFKKKITVRIISF
jgi:hypothetical protein